MSKMRFTSALIDDNIVSSNIAHDIRFETDMRAVRMTRKNNMKITQMLWIKKEPVIDCSYTLYNPSALIMLFLN